MRKQDLPAIEVLHINGYFIRLDMAEVDGKGYLKAGRAGLRQTRRLPDTPRLCGNARSKAAA